MNYICVNEPLPQSCYIKCPLNFFDPFFYYFQDLNRARRDVTFPTFIKRTNEKNQTIEIAETFLDNYLPKLIKECQILDLGPGEGDLSLKVASYMKGKCENTLYEGIDISEKFVASTHNKLLTIGIKNQNIIVGNCFGGDIDRLVNYPTLLIASQVLFYAPDISVFIEKIIKKMGAVAIIVGQSNFSFLNKMNKAYAAPYKQTDTETKFDKTIPNYQSIINTKILYNSIIKFPQTVSVKKISSGIYEELVDIDEKEGREILEFIAGSPLEYLEYTGKLSSFVQDIEKHLRLNEGDIGFWNFMSILTPSNQLNEEELMAQWKAIQKQKFSRNLSQFENALKEGNIQIIKKLFKQGLTICELHTDIIDQHDSEYVDKLFALLIYWLGYPVRAAEIIFDWPLFSPIQIIKWVVSKLGGENYNTNFKSFYSPEIDKLQGYRYNAEEIDSQINELLELWHNNFTIIEYSYNQYNNKDGSLIWHLFYLGIVMAPVFLSSDIYNYNGPIGLQSFKYIASLNLIFCYTFYNYFDVNNYFIHVVDGDNQILQFYLREKSNVKTVNFQNFESQTPLHLAIINNDMEKTLNILACKATKINVPDVFGKLPIHYAVEHNNLKIVKKLLDRGNDINVTVFNSIKLVFDIFFLSGKLLFFDASFTYYFRNSITKNLLDWTITGTIYLCSKMYGIRYPENFYYHAFLQQHNPLGKQKSYLFESDNTYKGYGLDTSLHISTKFNYTELTKYLIRMGVNSDLPNSQGETALHFAAANRNLDLLILLTNNASSVNQQGGVNELSIYFYYAVALKVFISSNTGTLMTIIGEILFFKIIHNDIFESLHIFTSATPLHYACLGKDFKEKLYSKFIEEKSDFDDDIEESQKLEAIQYLINKGADSDITFNYYISPENYIINQVLYITIILAIPLALYTQTPTRASIVLPLLLIKQFFPYDIKSLKALDLISAETNIYKYLYQYTTLNEYTDTAQMSFFSLQYCGYLLGIVSDQDVIQIKDYGMYKGGSGKDKFVINKNYRGKKQGYKIIIKDYESGEEIILDDSYENFNISSLIYTTELIMNKTSTIIKTEEGEEVLTLWNYLKEREGEITILSTISTEAKSDFLVSNDITLKNELSKEITMNNFNWYDSKDKKVVLKLNYINESKDQCRTPIISNFNCKLGNHILDLSKIERVVKLTDLELEQLDKSVLIRREDDQEELLLLQGAYTEDITGECFLFGNISGD